MKLFTLLTGFLFILSFTGLLYGTKHLLCPDMTFVPAVAVCCVTLTVFFGGIAGVMWPAALCCFLAGLAGFIWMAADSRLKKWQPSFPSLAVVCFLATAWAFLHILPSQYLEHYDNFSHWAVVVKTMLTTNAFPTLTDTLVEFRNYPTGAACWIYFFCRFMGHSEGMMLLAQGILLFSLIFAVFGMVESRRVFLIYGILAVGCSLLTLFNVTIRINNLLVDFLLPLFVLACWAASLRYGDSLRQFVILIPLQGALLITKANGVAFCGFAAAGWVIHRLFLSDRHASLRIWLCGIVSLATSFLSWGAWKVHVSAAFPGVSNKFETDASLLLSGNSKTQEEICQIATLFLKTATDLTTRPALGFVCYNVVVLILIVCLRTAGKKMPGHLLASLLLLDLMVVLYYAGILAMYIFSMPVSEAVTLDGFERYACSIVVLFTGGIAMAVTWQYQHSISLEQDGHIHFDIPEEKLRYQRYVLYCVIVVLIALTSEYNGMLYNASSYSDSLPAKIRSVTGDRWYEGEEPDQTQYLFYGTDADGLMTNYYFHYVSRYYMYCSNVDAVCSFYEDNLDNLLSNYDMLCIIEPDESEADMLSQHYGITGEKGFYRIIRDGDTIQLEPQA